MLDLKWVTEHFDEARAGLARRGTLDPSFAIIESRAGERRKVITDLETLRAQRNETSASLAKIDKKSSEFQEARERMRTVGVRIKELQVQEREVQAAIEDALLRIPNIPHPSVPDGAGSDDNPVVRTWGDPPQLSFPPKDHHE